jgi:arylsulfatase
MLTIWLFDYPPQFKVGFMSNNPPVYDVVPEAKVGLKAWLKEHGFGRWQP